MSVVGSTLDSFWTLCVEQRDPFTFQPSFAQYYNSDLQNGKDAQGTMMPDGVTPVRFTSSSLNQLVASAYAWYWLQSNDDTYRDQSDKLWTAGVMGAGRNCRASITNQDYTYMGKQYSQNFKWSYDFLNWRTRPESKKAPGQNQPTGTQQSEYGLDPPPSPEGDSGEEAQLPE